MTWDWVGSIGHLVLSPYMNLFILLGKTLAMISLVLATKQNEEKIESETDSEEEDNDKGANGKGRTDSKIYEIQTFQLNIKIYHIQITMAEH